RKRFSHDWRSVMHATEAAGDRIAMRVTNDSETGASEGSSRVTRIASAALRSVLPGRALGLALVLGLAFAAVDGVRAFADAQREVELRAGLAAAQMAPRAADLPRAEAAPGVLDGVETLVVADDGTVLASTLPEITPDTLEQAEI